MPNCSVCRLAVSSASSLVWTLAGTLSHLWNRSACMRASVPVPLPRLGKFPEGEHDHDGTTRKKTKRIEMLCFACSYLYLVGRQHRCALLIFLFVCL